mmetsp:Transcript_3854/g.13518  ORF Transcript_3854/g.13518 Transcript_3854/m.13518 type:complete len:149 (+) Transcript_3854:209-655(+)
MASTIAPGGGSLPLAEAPHDSLRAGLPNLKQDATVAHPVQQIQRDAPAARVAQRVQNTTRVYGAALPAKMQIEEQILGRVGRLPGLPSSRLGLDAMTGRLDELDYSDTLGFPSERETSQVNLHVAMEHRLGLEGPKRAHQPGAANVLH